MNGLDPAFVLSNRIEAGLWMTISISMLVAAIRSRGDTAFHIRCDNIIGAIAFALFGASDLVEATTGAWWRPWWLLVWKGLCIVVFLVLLMRYARRRRVG